MAPTALAALALLARTATAGRGSVALEVGGGTHVRAVRAHHFQDISEVMDRFGEVQDQGRVDELGAVQLGGGAVALQGGRANTTAEANMSAGCRKCKWRKFWVALRDIGLAVSVNAFGYAITHLDGDDHAVAWGRTGLSASFTLALFTYSAFLAKDYPCDDDIRKQEQFRQELQAHADNYFKRELNDQTSFMTRKALVERAMDKAIRQKVDRLVVAKIFHELVRQAVVTQVTCLEQGDLGSKVQQPPRGVPALPSGWQKATDDSGAPFYYNLATGKSQREFPGPSYSKPAARTSQPESPVAVESKQASLQPFQIEAAPREVFEPAKEFQGARPGWAFKMGSRGLGYYRDAKQEAVKGPPRVTPAALPTDATPQGHQVVEVLEEAEVQELEEREGPRVAAPQRHQVVEVQEEHSFETGDSVTLKDMTARPDLNGQAGILEQFHEGAWTLRIMGSDEVVLVKPENLVDAEA